MTRVGFLAPLTTWNDLPLEFLRVAPEGTSVAGAFIPSRGQTRTMAGFGLDRIAEALPAMQEAARDLAEAGADVVAQFGIPFSLTHAKRARDAQSQVSDAAGVPAVLMGASILDALDYLGARRIAIAGGYYTPGEWVSMARHGFESNGFEVVLQENWLEQGIVGSAEESDKLAWEQDAATTNAHVLRTAERAEGRADAIVVCGGGLRLLGHAANLEAKTGVPVVAGDLAMYWGTLRAMGAQPRSTGWGRLLDSL
ncbi:MAG: aspartate/glutamate racemase family protein [Chloroflexi bacterium]|nr:aspartate/glutamate racemase family protein [Chloroflexota bacterium]